MAHRTAEELGAQLDFIRSAPLDEGTVRMLVRRPAVNEREIVEEAAFDQESGLVGDNWGKRRSRSTPDGLADPRAQVTVTGWRAMSLLADTEAEVALAGDQIFVDLDLSFANLPTGTRLHLGGAVLEVTAKPHTGCYKFRARFGGAALRFVNTKEGAQLRLRGINTTVVTAGSVRVGDPVTVVRPAWSPSPAEAPRRFAPRGAGLV